VPRRGRPPKKSAPSSPAVQARPGGDLTALATRAVATESVKTEPASATPGPATELPQLTVSHAVSIDKHLATVEPQLATIDSDLCAEQTIVIGGNADNGTLTLGRLDSAAGTVYVFHPLVDDSGQRIAFQAFKQLFGRSEVDADPIAASGCATLLVNTSASDVLNSTADLTSLLCASGATEIKQTSGNIPEATS
jgi:hypothetical protein